MLQLCISSSVARQKSTMHLRSCYLQWECADTPLHEQTRTTQRMFYDERRCMSSSPTIPIHLDESEFLWDGRHKKSRDSFLSCSTKTWVWNILWEWTLSNFYKCQAKWIELLFSPEIWCCEPDLFLRKQCVRASNLQHMAGNAVRNSPRIDPLVSPSESNAAHCSKQILSATEVSSRCVALLISEWKRESCKCHLHFHWSYIEKSNFLSHLLQNTRNYNLQDAFEICEHNLPPQKQNWLERQNACLLHQKRKVLGSSARTSHHGTKKGFREPVSQTVRAWNWLPQNSTSHINYSMGHGQWGVGSAGEGDRCNMLRRLPSPEDIHCLLVTLAWSIRVKISSSDKCQKLNKSTTQFSDSGVHLTKPSNFHVRGISLWWGRPLVTSHLM